MVHNKTYLPLLGLILSGWLLSSYTPIHHLSNTADITSDQPIAILNQDFVKVLDLQVTAHTLYQDIDFEFTYTSFIFEVSRDADFIGTLYHSSENEAYALDSLPQTDQPGEERRSPFIIPNRGQTRFNFYSGSLSGKVRIYLFYAPPIELNKTKRHNKKASSYCDKPEVIKGDLWRNGLPNPTGTRINHQVNHCIVHHAASSNSNHDYVNVVRNIYLLHTQTNGWDDIGYNFVVAQDGSIFEGRANQDIDSTDNIKGAHFCGKNTNTMGICVLGNYQETKPTTEAINTLTHLLTWKCYKDKINPLSSTPHPNWNSENLEHIAGHQDGCATACPGDSLYMRLPRIKETIDSILKVCNSVSIHDARLESSIYWYQSESSQDVIIVLKETANISTLYIQNSVGKVVHQRAIQLTDKQVTLPRLSAGVYIAYFEMKSGDIVHQKIQVK
ncbi:MAG: hypothetical protein ACI9JN_000299 [Bacteroidia bacterium]